MRRNYLNVRILLNTLKDKTRVYHGEFDRNRTKIQTVAHLPSQYRMSKKPSYATVSFFNYGHPTEEVRYFMANGSTSMTTLPRNMHPTAEF
jgi:hypothetical protein